MKAAPKKSTPGSQDDQFELILSGRVMENYPREHAIAWLAQTLKVPTEKASTLLAGKPRRIKQGLNRKSAKQFQSLFQSHGIHTQLRSQATAKQSAAGEPEAPTQVLQTFYFNGNLPPIAENNRKLASALSLLPALLAYGTVLALLAVVGLNRLLSLIWLETGTGTFALIALHIAPAVLAMLLLLLLARPLLQGRSLLNQRICIDTSDESKLFQFVREIAQQISAPMPSSIRLCGDSTCECDYVYDWPHVRRGTRHLNIGLALLTALSSRQLAALLAHELSMQKSATLAFMGSWWKRLNTQLQNAAKNQDSWSKRLSKIRANQPLAVLLEPVFALLMLSSWLLTPFYRLFSRCNQWYLISRVRAADEAAVQLVGTRDFTESLLQVLIVEHAFKQATKRVFNSFGKQKLTDDLPALVHHYYQDAALKARSQLEDAINIGETRWSDDYPSDRDRIIFAEERDLKGIASRELPARALLKNFQASCKEGTLAFYRSQGYNVPPDALIDVGELTAAADKDKLRDKLSANYFNHWLHAQSFWHIPSPDVIRDLSNEERIKQLNQTIAKIRHASPEYKSLVESEPRLLQAYTTFATAVEVHKAGYAVKATELNMSQEQAENFLALYDRAKREYTVLTAHLDQHYEMMGSRLLLSVSLHPERGKRQLGIVLLQTLACLYDHMQRLRRLHVRVSILPIIAARVSSHGEQGHEKRIQRICRDISDFSKTALAELDTYKCSFHPDFSSIAGFMRAHIKQELDHNSPQPNQAVAFYNEVIYSLQETNRAINGQLAIIAREAELFNKIQPVRLTP